MAADQPVGLVFFTSRQEPDTMNDLLRSSLPQMSLLQSLPTLELQSSCYQADIQSFTLELIKHTNKVRAIALAFFIIGILAIIGTLGFEAWRLFNSQNTDLKRDASLTVQDYLHWDVITKHQLR